MSFVEGIPSPDQAAFVAVLPFEYGADSSLGYLADGLSAGLAARLSNFRSLYVSPADLVKQEVAATGVGRESIARRLGVNLLIEGKMQESTGTVKVALSMYDVVHSRVLETAELTGERSQLVGLENQIYDRVANQMRLQNSEGSFRAGMKPTRSNHAYDHYLKARYIELNQQDPKELDTAIGLYQDAINIEHTFSLAYIGLARCYLSQLRSAKNSKVPQKAMTAAQQAAQLDDDSPDAHTVLSDVYKSAKNKEKSLEELNRAAELDPKSDAAYRNLGDAYIESGDEKGHERRSIAAIFAYKKALSVNPYYWMNHISLGDAYWRLGDNAKALPEFQKVTELAPDNPIGYNKIGSMYLREGKWSESIPQFQKAQALAPDADTYSNLGTAFFFLRRYDEAAKMFEKALQMNGSPDEVSWGNLGDVYRWLGQTDKARSAYKKAIGNATMSSDAQSAGTLGDLATLYAKIGDQAQAVRDIRLARAKKPEDMQLMYSEAQVYVLLGQATKAMPAFRRAIAKGYPRKEIWSDPENAKMQSLPEFVKLVGPSAAK
jgi:tetratricopeptide (TPR) repeat protein